MSSFTLIVVILAIPALARFLTVSQPRQRIAVLLAWLFPGAGHIWLGRKDRGLLLGAIVVVLFVAGMALSDFRNISPFERHPIWGAAHMFGGLLTALATGATWNLQIERDLPYYHVGCLYSAVATLLNLLLMVDAWDLADEATEPAKTGPEALA